MANSAAKKGARILGADRDKLASEFKKAYEKGATIRQLAEQTGRSYGFVNRILIESGVELRPRGGPRPGPRNGARN